MTVEIVVYNIASALKAQEGGADRVELCDNPGEGGTTPSYGMIRMAREKTNLQLYPIIRPRGGDFLYSDDEFRMMMHDIQMCKEIGCEGVVIGLLKPDGTIDGLRTAKLVNAAYPMGVTFHRAFDRTIDPFEALEDIIEIGCERILTSGQRPTALEGANLIKQLLGHANGRIIIMPGSGVRADNVIDLAEKTNAVEFHTSARKVIPNKMDYKNPEMNESLDIISVDADEVTKIARQLSHLKSS